MTPREERGLQIAATTKLQQKGQKWLVPSQTGSGQYEVVMDKTPRCSCPDFEFRNQPCKHIHAVEYTIKREFHDDGTETVTQTVKVTYSQDWPKYNAAQVNEKRDFMSLLRTLCQDIEEPKQTGRGRPKLPLSDMLYSATLKVYSTISARRFMSDLSEAHEKGYLSRLPHYNSIFVYFEKPELTGLLQEKITQCSLPLASIERNFAVDSSGFSTSKKANWFDSRYGTQKNARMDWVKCHIMTGCSSNVVTACEIGTMHDSKMFPHLVNRTAQNFSMNEVSADKGYISKRNLELVDSHGATPYIPFKSNTVLRDDNDLWSKMYHMFAFNRDEFLAQYHQRSNVETAFHMIKAKFGGFVRSKNRTAQINEVLCKILSHNLCCLISAMYELGMMPNCFPNQHSSHSVL